MANYEQKNGQITVWKNDKYTVGGNQPYAKGTGKDLQGNDVDVTLWIPKSDKIKGFNMTIAPAYKKEVAQAKKAETKDEEPTNNLPF